MKNLNINMEISNEDLKELGLGDDKINDTSIDEFDLDNFNFDDLVTDSLSVDEDTTIVDTKLAEAATIVDTKPVDEKQEATTIVDATIVDEKLVDEKQEATTIVDTKLAEDTTIAIIEDAKEKTTVLDITVPDLDTEGFSVPDLDAQNLDAKETETSKEDNKKAKDLSTPDLDVAVTEKKPVTEKKRKNTKKKESNKNVTFVNVNDISSKILMQEDPEFEKVIDKLKEGIEKTRVNLLSINDTKKSKEEMLSLLSSIDNLRTDIFMIRSIYKSNYETSKSLIAREESKASNGTLSASDRKKEMILSLEKYEIEKNSIVNLYALKDELKRRFILIDSFYETINKKQDILITLVAIKKQ